MKKVIITKELSSLLEVIKEQQEMILSHEGKIPQIELDILMGNVRMLYERLTELNKENSIPGKEVVPAIPDFVPEQRGNHPDELIARISSAVEAPVEINIPDAVENIIDQSPNETENISQPVAHLQPEELIANVETPVEESPIEISNEAVMPQAALARERSKEYSKPAAKNAYTASLFDDQPTVAEKFKGSPSVYDKLSATKQDSSLAEKLLRNPVSDLKKSIGINEKFSFINELFNGDLNLYNEAIDKLNTCADQQEAINFLEADLSEKHNWNDESESFLKLKNLVERRFFS